MSNLSLNNSFSTVSIARVGYKPASYKVFKPEGLPAELFSEYAPWSPHFEFAEHEFFGRAYNGERLNDIYISQDTLRHIAITNVAERYLLNPLKLPGLKGFKQGLVDAEIKNLRSKISLFQTSVRLAQDVPPDFPLDNKVIDLTHADYKVIWNTQRSLIKRVKIVTKELFIVRYVLKVSNKALEKAAVESEISFIASFEKKLLPDERNHLMRTPIPVDSHKGLLMRYYNRGSLVNCLDEFDRVEKLRIASSLVYQLHLISKKIRGNYNDIKLENVLVHLVPKTDTTYRVIAHLADFELCTSIPDPELPDSEFEEEVSSKKFISANAPITRHITPMKEIRLLEGEILKTKDIQHLKRLFKKYYAATVKQQQFAMGCVIYQIFTGVSFETFGDLEPKTRYVDTRAASIKRQLNKVEPVIKDIILSLIDLETQVDLQKLSEQLQSEAQLEDEDYE